MVQFDHATGSTHRQAPLVRSLTGIESCSFPPSNSHCFVTGELSLFAAQMSGVAAMAPHCASNTATSRPQVVHIPAIHPPTGGPAAATPINTCPTSKRLFLTVCESDIRSAQLGWGGLVAAGHPVRTCSQLGPPLRTFGVAPDEYYGVLHGCTRQSSLLSDSGSSRYLAKVEL